VQLLTLDVAADLAPDVAGLSAGYPWIDGDGAVCARVLRQKDADWIAWSGLGLFKITHDTTTIQGWRAEGVAEGRFRDAFERRLQPLILQSRGYQALHGSAVVTRGAAAVFVGRSGSGKSTLGYALQHDGCAQIADDAVVIDGRGRPPLVVTLPFTPQLKGEAAELRTQEAPIEKEGTATRVPLGIVVLLRQDDSAGPEPRVRRLDGPAACVTLLTHAHVFDPAADPAGLVEAYATIADATPVFELGYRPVISELPSLVRACRVLIAAPPAAPAHGAPMTV
jgi:hypothetical protein